ncbi:hypothetical protein EYF80_028853 [Liparis tanakae]|uniref:Uncharacterized protein n=1 Tax=Liparis tanakae TaxID=230148 RepID=A0A4Z2H4S6_9TELE|nr:hypothetical protein EYF80_028853 [Liparis tanakae]
MQRDQSDSHCAVGRRQIQRSLSLCVPTTPISPKVQKKIHNVGSSSSSRSMERTVPPTPDSYVCSYRCTDTEMITLPEWSSSLAQSAAPAMQAEYSGVPTTGSSMSMSAPYDSSSSRHSL